MKADTKAQSHPLQSAAWAQFRATTGIEVAKFQEWYITFHRIPHTPWTIGYFPKGPLPTTSMVKDLLFLARQKKAIFIQLEPNVEKQNKTLKLASVRPSHHPLFTKYTFILDLTKSEEELLRTMHSKTRYNIRVAQKHGVTIQEDNSQQAFDEYLKLSEETTTRQKFYAHNKTYHQTLWNVLHKAGIAHLFTATYQGKTLAAWIIFVWKNTIYYPYGASSREHREVMAPNLLLWEIARWAKTKKISYFDLWGAMGPNPDVNDPWYGFHRFKEGFAPRLVEYIGSYDVIAHPFLYALYTIADTLRWTLLKFKKR